jgi:signal transduction histidine kinase
MIKLVPEWIETNEEFWLSLKRRNLFFIKLRFVAILMLIAFNYFYEIIVKIELTALQHNTIGLVTLILLIYNLSLFLIRKRIKNIRGNFNPLHLSLVQILVDLTMLTILIVFTGGIESPLYLFYIFHLIIGSLILPGVVIYSIAFATIIAMTVISFFQYSSIIPHFCLEGIYKTELYNNPEYIITTLLFFSLTTMVSVYLTNRIANQLYLKEKNLFEALKEINDSELKKQKYIMGVVHEIKSPIAATKSIVSLITDGFLGEVSPKIKEKLDRAIVRSTESLEMINNILRISRLRLLDEKTSEDVDINELLDEIIDLNMEYILEKKIKFKKSSSNNFRMLKGDRVLLKLAFSNLIGNAIKYTPKDGIVNIDCKFSDDSILILICDSGIGISKGELKKIFENYYRASNINQVNHEGAGVGLSLVKEIIHQHRGKITVVSPSPIGTAENIGTCFEITIPYELKEVMKEKGSFFSVKSGV